MSELPDYHCPDCRDLNCLHCFCVVSTVCETCEAFREGEQVSEDKITLKIDSVDKLTEHWIAEGERIATERIIKLLEADGAICRGHWSHSCIDLDKCTETPMRENWHGDGPCEAHYMGGDCDQLIALIKGEK